MHLPTTQFADSNNNCDIDNDYSGRGHWLTVLLAKMQVDIIIFTCQATDRTKLVLIFTRHFGKCLLKSTAKTS